jgi:ABC-type multidrug transport system ATPase subunit
MASASAPPIAASSVPLRIEGLMKRFGELTAVDGVSLELKPGECMGLLGPNGAGKSTLICSIVGRVIPDAGKVRSSGTVPIRPVRARR